MSCVDHQLHNHGIEQTKSRHQHVDGHKLSCTRKMVKAIKNAQKKEYPLLLNRIPKAIPIKT